MVLLPNYRDEDITFFMGLYRDRGEGALERLREHFPDARVVVRSDGDAHPENQKLSERYGVEYFEEERLFPIENGGRLIARILELYLDSATRYLFKIDTDTAVYRRFHYLPERDGVFGSIQRSPNGSVSLQGGCTGFSEQAARAIFNSGMLNDPRLKDPCSYQKESRYFRRIGMRAKRCGLTSFDWIIGWAASELHIPMFSYSEVHSRGKPGKNVANEDLQYAITHPVYF